MPAPYYWVHYRLLKLNDRLCTVDGVKGLISRSEHFITLFSLHGNLSDDVFLKYGVFNEQDG
jgi:hypothetical protein